MNTKLLILDTEVKHMENEFNKQPLTTLAATLANIIETEPPKQASTTGVKEIEELVATKSTTGKVDRMLIYNPDAIGQWFYNKYKDMFKEVEANSDIAVPYITAFPPKTPVCFATMFSGAAPEVHGITKYEKPVLKIDTLFDSWVRGGKKVAMVAVANQSIPRIFADRNIDYYLLPYDGEVVEKALELIALNKYDIIEVYNQEYDDVMHRSHPESKRSFRAIEHYVESYKKLTAATAKHWAAHNTFTAFATDHGTHRMLIGLGMHGSNIPKDMNILHFYGVQPAKLK
ncbi:MAG: hypothetical protein R3Y23_06585 [Bacillota bacterium]